MISATLFSQEDEQVTDQKHELSTNLLDLVVAGSININYEHLLKNNQSYAVNATFFDTFGYYDVGYIEKNTAVSLKASYILYFNKKKNHSGFFFYPFAKYRTGEITTSFGFFDFGDDPNNDFTYDVSGFSVGFGIGHKWVFNNKFTLGLNGELGRTLGNNEFEDIDVLEVRFGVNFGVRF